MITVLKKTRRFLTGLSAYSYMCYIETHSALCEVVVYFDPFVNVMSRSHRGVDWRFLRDISDSPDWCIVS